MKNSHLTAIEHRIEPLRKRILEHSLYDSLNTMDDLRRFMESHIFAVWDFMSLLKGLQKQLTSVDEAWVPTESKLARRLVNEIVLAEESDEDPEGNPASHYELYLDAMRQAGANTRPVNHFIQTLQRSFKVKDILKYNLAELDEAILHYLRANYAIVKRGKVHEMAAAFTYGREDLIPDMFTEIVKELHNKFPNQLDAFVYYLDRHIELDGDEHGPMALKMITELCGNDEQKWMEAEDASVEALEARLMLWNSIEKTIHQRSKAGVERL
ncbi:MAG: DUF3050 domain-containing protein [Bacteroidetes bacterium]|nr:MAG: DUF3050 domain-containing protein [Bacteroidota bacterium]